jgi:hypothetical protein
MFDHQFPVVEITYSLQLTDLFFEIGDIIGVKFEEEEDEIIISKETDEDLN